ncbi:hypothetical protein HMPREF0322_02727 [Desulfitobacterium hafniense DP7]|uniref:Uncharacterized protein n=1 Tax=Desulfitobacterium hafniense DP7 TaxID=537010 RepID=G9XP32_DESHA|nr:hypothetical protein HMPREF0322_02727 [Desulfitobacterium hafniense DP7]
MGIHYLPPFFNIKKQKSWYRLAGVSAFLLGISLISSVLIKSNSH